MACICSICCTEQFIPYETGGGNSALYDRGPERGVEKGIVLVMQSSCPTFQRRGDTEKGEGGGEVK